MPAVWTDRNPQYSGALYNLQIVVPLWYLLVVMPGSKQKLFLSYAWNDDQPFVERLYNDLHNEGHEPWMDKKDMPSRGRTLPQEVVRQINDCDRVIAVIGPAALCSAACQAEREYASDQGKVITCILRQGDYRSLPDEFRQYFVPDFRKEKRPYEIALEELSRVLADEPVTPAPLFYVPAPPAHFKQRLDELRKLREAITAKQLKPVVVTSVAHVALQGMGGVGKTVLAAALAHDYTVRRTFRHGVIWLDVGQQPNRLSLLKKAGTALGDDPKQYADPDVAPLRFQRAIEGKECLLVLDDVWDAGDIEPLLNASQPLCALLITTRNLEVVNALGAEVQPLDVLTDAMAWELLTAWAGQPLVGLPEETRSLVADVAKECGNLPLALAQSGAPVKEGTSWADILDALRHGDISFIERRLPNYKYLSVFKALGASLKVMGSRDPAAVRHYLELAVFPHDAAIPEAAVVTLWTHTNGQASGQRNAFTERHARKLVTTLHDLALIRRLEGEAPNRRLVLHDLQADYVRAACDDVKGLHTQLLQAYKKKCVGGWHTGPNDGYFFQRVSHHLTQAGREEEFRSLLLDFGWLQAKLTNVDTQSLLEDCELSGQRDVLFVKGVITLARGVLEKDKTQLASQLWGRLPRRHKRINRLLSGAHAPKGQHWLRPITSSLAVPGGPLLRTITQTHNISWILPMTLDGRQLVSPSSGRTLTVWDINTGQEMSRLTAAHRESIELVVVSPDGHIAISSSYKGELVVWDLSKGRPIYTLRERLGPGGRILVTSDSRKMVAGGGFNNPTARVWALDTGTELARLLARGTNMSLLALTPDGDRAVTATSVPGDAIQVWNVTNGKVLLTIPLPSRCLLPFAIMPDGTTVIFCSTIADGLQATRPMGLELWSIQTGCRIRGFEGHSDRINALAVAPDGSTVVSASDDCTLRVWNVQAGTLRAALDTHKGQVHDVTITPNGKRIVSASFDTTLKVWDLQSGKELLTLNGHSEFVKKVAVTPDSRRVISSSDDNTVKVWDIRTERSQDVERHNHAVTAIEVTPDGKRVVSASEDGTVKVWDIHTGNALRTLAGQGSGIVSIAVTSDGKRIVSASGDGTLTIWDLDAGQELHVLEGHSSYIEALVVTPDGRLAISSSHEAAIVWDIRSGRRLAALQGYSGKGSEGVFVVAITPDGETAISSAFEGALKAWRVGRWVQPRHLDFGFFACSVAVTPDSQKVVAASAYDNTIKAWNIESGEILFSREGYSRGNDVLVKAIKITPDGSRVVSGSDDGTLKVWDIGDGGEVFSLRGHTDSIESIAITGDGRRLLSSSRDDTLKVWDLATGRLAATFFGDSHVLRCAAAPDGVTVIAGETSGRVHFLRLECG